jgi:hypothetical protein
MTLVDEVRTDIQQDIFNTVGKNITLIKKSTPIYNTRGELTGYSSLSSTIVGVPYNIVESRYDPQPFGQYNSGDMAVFIPYTAEVKIDDELIIESEKYKIVEIQKHYIPENVGTLLRVSKVHDYVPQVDEE